MPPECLAEGRHLCERDSARYLSLPRLLLAVGWPGAPAREQCLLRAVASGDSAAPQP